MHSPPTHKELWKHSKALVILRLLASLGGQAVHLNTMAKALNASTETIQKELTWLSTFNLLTRPRLQGGWFLTSAGLHALAPAPLELPPGEDADFPQVGSTTTTALNSKKHQNKAAAAAQDADFPHLGPGDADFPHLKTATVDNSVDNFTAANLEALAQWGVKQNSLTRALAADPSITPDYINRHAQRLHAEERFSPRLLINVLRDHDPLPTVYGPKSHPAESYKEWEII